MNNKLLKKLEEKVKQINESENIEQNTQEVYETILESIINNMNSRGVEIDLGITLTMVDGFKIGSIRPIHGPKIHYTIARKIDFSKLQEMLLEDGIKINKRKQHNELHTLPRTFPEYYISLTLEDLKNIVENQNSKQKVKK